MTKVAAGKARGMALWGTGSVDESSESRFPIVARDA